MNIVADENIPRAVEAFGRFGDVRLLAGRAITREELAESDILIVRSITTVDRALLEGTPVRFVGTATNGIDHIDLDYLREYNIAFAHAAGSNAGSVAQYVVAALLELRARGLASLQGEKLGIVGVGAIGSRLARYARALGMDVVEYDPPKALREPGFRSAPFEELFTCDIISLHVPLETGEHPTWHFVDEKFLSRIPSGSILINTSRGGVVDSGALLSALRAGHLRTAVLDVWEGEPDVPRDLLEQCVIATPHIAGYSYDAKLKWTGMMAVAVGRFLEEGGSILDFGFSIFDWKRFTVDDLRFMIEGGGNGEGDGHRVGMDGVGIDRGVRGLDGVREAVQCAYDIMRDDAGVRDLLGLDDASRRAGFDRLRKNYPVRREFQAFAVVSDDPDVRGIVSAFGFQVPQ